MTTGTKLARAFSTYFHLANITEQVHRARELRRRARPRGRLAGPGRQADRRARACRPSEIAAAARRLAVRPVFTAHPTEAARRSILSKLRGDRRRAGRRGRRAVALRRQPTRRPRRPPPRRAARPAVADRRAAAGPAGPDRRGPQRGLLPARPVRRGRPAGARRPGRHAARRSAWRPPPTARPLTFGTWIGGDRDGNPYVTPAVTRDVLLIQHEHGIRGRRDGDGRPDQRGVGVPPAARGVARPVRQPRRRPGRAARGGRSGSAGSTPRSRTGSRLRCIQAKLANTRHAAGQRHRRTCPAATTAAPPS